MGGVGKTELAIKYAREHEADYPGGICWLNAREGNLEAQIIQFVQRDNLQVPQQDFQQKPLTLAEQVAWCWQNWQPSEGLVLVVFDDVTDLKSIRGVLPRSHNRFQVLITTRLRRLDSNFIEISLDVLSEDEALQQLTAILGEEDRRIKREPETAKDLCKWLGYLPLGIELVGRYLVEDPDLSLAEMLQALQKQKLQNRAINPSPEELQETEMTANLGVQAAFDLSWQKLDVMSKLVGELLSLFAPAAIPWELVESASQGMNWEKEDVNEAKKQLYKYHLIQRLESEEKSYKIHTLIQEFLRAKFVESENKNDLKQALIATIVPIAKKTPHQPTLEYINSVSPAIPHLEEVANNLIDVVENEDLIWVFAGLGNFYQGQGFYPIAETWRFQCMEIVKVRLGKLHPYFADSLNDLAQLYCHQGRYGKAENLYKQALEIMKLMFCGLHPKFATTLNNLALLYHSQGRYKEAEKLYKQIVELRKRLLGKSHPKFAISLNNLASLYNSQGRYKEAEPLYEQALEIRRRLLGESHLDTVGSLTNLANLYFYQGRYSKAEPLLKQVLELYKDLLGEQNLSVAISLNSLANLYHSQGRYSKAERLYKQALEIYKGLLGEEHPDIATNLNNLAQLYYSQRRYDEAEPLYKQALEQRKRLLGEQHPDFALSLNNLGCLYDSQGRYSEAEHLLIQALEIRLKVLGENHHFTQKVAENLALVRAEMEKHNP